MSLLGYERGEAAATNADPLPGRARPAVRCWPRSAASTEDPIIRQRLAWCYGKVQIMRYLGMRIAHPVPRRPPPGARRRDHQAVLERVPPGRHRAGASTSSAPTRSCRPGRQPSSAFQTDDAGAPNSSASWVDTFLNARAGTIYAGSSQIQRNIIGEMVLGLPEGAEAGVIRAVAGAVLRRPDAVAGGAAAVAAHDARLGGGGGGRSCPSRRAEYLRFRLLTQYGDSETRACQASMW